MSEIFAKSKNEITLFDHTAELLKQFDVLKEKVPQLKTYEKEIRFCIFAHDLGKCSPIFQESLKNFKYKPSFLFPDIPHSIFSLFFLNHEKVKEDFENAKLIYSAIAFHHWRDSFPYILLGSDEEIIEGAKILLENENFRDKLIENLKYELLKDKLAEFEKYIGFNEDFAEALKACGDMFSYLIPPYHATFLPKREDFFDEEIKKKFILILGTLIRVDHFASFVHDHKEVPNLEIEKSNLDFKTIENAVKKVIGEKTNTNSEEMKLWQIDALKEKRGKNIILIAPTGSGKSEFSFLWGENSKIFYTLPLRSAVNAIYDRAKEIFGEKYSGLLHSDADVYLYKNKKDDDFESENIRVIDLAKQLALNISVSTGDQIFPTALKYPSYERIYSTLAYSKLIIDEVQSYSPQSSAIIIKLIEDTVKLGGKFLLMTATLPDFIKEEIEKRVGEIGEPINKYLEAKAVKHKYKLTNEDITNGIDNIINMAKKGNRVLVIVNTVKKAIETYKELKNQLKNEKEIFDQCYLLHSKFTLNDRAKKEEVLTNKFNNPKAKDENTPKILVATQVVEASLDIDCDILFTEIAPIDALIQRMGRVSRRIKFDENFTLNENDEANIIIFVKSNDKKESYESGDGYVYKNELLEKSYAILTNDENVKKIYEKKYKPDENKSKGSKKKSKEDQEYNLIQNKDYIFDLPDKEKNNKVNDLYKDLPKDKGYLTTFYKMLDLLDSGYMSDKKNEALKAFRDIATIPAIPLAKKDELQNAIDSFKGTSFTEFKVDVMSKFVVNVSLRKHLKELHNTASNHLYITDKKIKRWLDGVYIFDFKYTEYGYEDDVEYEVSNII